MAQRVGPPGTVRVAISGTSNSLPYANVFWCNLTGGTTATQGALDAWVSSFSTAYTNAFQAHMNVLVNIGQAQATLFQTPPTALHSVHVINLAGTKVGTGISDNSACVVLSWASSVYWRGGKPRTYLPGIVNTDVVNGHTIATAADTEYTSAANSFLTLVNALSATGITQTQLGFVSFFSAKVPRNPPIFFPILAGSVHGRLGSQRRRLGAWLP